ncbi:hypothetical protein FQR65_LT20649 [Abscondita terminalis]|nr:hypothetical protein FQR65_LT20649 [Abscondita terminalis]
MPAWCQSSKFQELQCEIVHTPNTSLMADINMEFINGHQIKFSIRPKAAADSWSHWHRTGSPEASSIHQILLTILYIPVEASQFSLGHWDIQLNASVLSDQRIVKSVPCRLAELASCTLVQLRLERKGMGYGERRLRHPMPLLVW